MLKTYRGISPTIAPNAFIEDTAVVIGDVDIGSDSSVWFQAVVRGDSDEIVIGVDGELGLKTGVRAVDVQAPPAGVVRALSG